MTPITLRRRATRAGAALAGGALLAAAPPAVAAAQSAAGGIDALAGCWESDAAPRGEATRFLCVVPTGSGGEVATVDSGRVVVRTPITAGGERQASTRDGCTGWESARLATGGQRVYLRTEYRCPGDLVRTTTGLLALNSVDELLDIQSVRVRTGVAVRVGHYRPASPNAPLPNDLADVAVRSLTGLAANSARVAASAPITTGDVVDATRVLEPGVVEAWLVERQQRFALDAKTLVALARAGVPGRVTDMMIALSNPKRFAVNPATGASELRPAVGAATTGDLPLGSSGRRIYADVYGVSPYGGFGPYSSFYGLGFGLGGYGFGRGYGWYPGGAPVIVVRDGGAAGVTAAPRVRAVNGQGYRSGRSTATGASSNDRPAMSRARGIGRFPTDGGSAAGRVGGSSAGSSGQPSGGSEGGSGRTAKPRP